MKKILVALVALFFLAGIAEAGPKEAKFKHADKNKDGSVDKKEMRMEKDWEHRKKEKAKKIFTISEFSKSEIVHFYHTDPSKIEVVYPSYDKETFHGKVPQTKINAIKKNTTSMVSFYFTGVPFNPGKTSSD